jgi:hypothetical protein
MPSCATLPTDTSTEQDGERTKEGDRSEGVQSKPCVNSALGELALLLKERYTSRSLDAFGLYMYVIL